MSKTDKELILSGTNPLSDFIFEKLLKNKLRMSIILLLRLSKELNVTEVSNYLNRSKATIGRHLKAMEKVGILTSEERESNRTIKPIYYRITDRINNFFEYEKPLEKRGNIQEKIKNLKERSSNAVIQFTREQLVLQTIVKLLEHSISLINPFLDHLKFKLYEKELDIDYLSKYLLIDNHLSCKHYTLSEEVLDEFYEVLYEFRDKMEDLSKKGNEKSILFIDSVIPLKEILRLSGNVELE